jgi:transposase
MIRQRLYEQSSVTDETIDSSTCINRMQKSHELMNLKIHTVLNDITGKIGQAIVEAIINGERNAVNFLPLIDKCVKASSDTI